MDKRRRDQRGFTLIELLVAVAILGIVAAVAIPAFASALAKAHRSALLADGRHLHEAMVRYNLDHGEFPSTSTPPTKFERATLEPLVGAGYVRSPGKILADLLDDEVTAYDSPDVGGGANREFWAVFTHRSDPALKLLVASTANYPGHSENLEGLYWIEGANLVRAR